MIKQILNNTKYILVLAVCAISSVVFASNPIAQAINGQPSQVVIMNEEDAKYYEKVLTEQDARYVECTQNRLKFPAPTLRPSITEVQTGMATDPAYFAKMMAKPDHSIHYSIFWTSILNVMKNNPALTSTPAGQAQMKAGIEQAIAFASRQAPYLIYTKSEIDKMKCVTKFHILDQTNLVNNDYTKEAMDAAIILDDSILPQEVGSLIVFDLMMMQMKDGDFNKIAEDISKLKFTVEYINKEQPIGNFYSVTLKGGSVSTFVLTMKTTNISMVLGMDTYNYQSFTNIIKTYLPAQLSQFSSANSTSNSLSAEEFAIQTVYYPNESYNFLADFLNSKFVNSPKKLPSELNPYIDTLKNIKSPAVLSKVAQRELNTYFSIALEGYEVNTIYTNIARSKTNSPILKNPNYLTIKALKNLAKNKGQLVVEAEDIAKMYTCDPKSTNLVSSPIAGITEPTLKDVYKTILDMNLTLDNKTLDMVAKDYDLKKEVNQYRERFKKASAPVSAANAPAVVANNTSAPVVPVSTASITSSVVTPKTVVTSPALATPASTTSLTRTGGVTTSYITMAGVLATVSVIATTLFLKSRKSVK
jgi:hypothetical protein